MADPGNWTFTNSAREKILKSQFDFDTDPFKCALFTDSSNLGASSTTYAGVTGEVSAANGYSTGGVSVAFTIAGTTSVTVSFTVNPFWVATGSGIVARYAAIYETSGDVVCYCLLDSTPANYTVPAGQTLTIDCDGTPGPVFTLA